MFGTVAAVQHVAGSISARKIVALGWGDIKKKYTPKGKLLIFKY